VTRTRRKTAGCSGDGSSLRSAKCLNNQARRVLEYMSGMIRYNSEGRGHWFESSRARQFFRIKSATYALSARSFAPRTPLARGHSLVTPSRITRSAAVRITGIPGRTSTRCAETIHAQWRRSSPRRQDWVIEERIVQAVEYFARRKSRLRSAMMDPSPHARPHLKISFTCTEVRNSLQLAVAPSACPLLRGQSDRAGALLPDRAGS
jgi:hypothetical protein